MCVMVQIFRRRDEIRDKSNKKNNEQVKIDIHLFRFERMVSTIIEEDQSSLYAFTDKC